MNKIKVKECITSEECFVKRQKTYAITLGVMSISILSVALVKEIDNFTNKVLN